MVIPPRFCGPARSGNGGYVCGRIAAYADGPLAVTLRRPPPLATPMTVEPVDDGSLRVRHGGTLIAETTFPPGPLAMEVPDPASLADARLVGRARAVLPRPALPPVLRLRDEPLAWRRAALGAVMTAPRRGVGLTPMETRRDESSEPPCSRTSWDTRSSSFQKAGGWNSTPVLTEIALRTATIRLVSGVLSVWGRTAATLAIGLLAHAVGDPRQRRSATSSGAPQRGGSQPPGAGGQGFHERLSVSSARPATSTPPATASATVSPRPDSTASRRPDSAGPRGTPARSAWASRRLRHRSDRDPSGYGQGCLSGRSSRPLGAGRWEPLRARLAAGVRGARPPPRGWTASRDSSRGSRAVLPRRVRAQGRSLPRGWTDRGRWRRRQQARDTVGHLRRLSFRTADGAPDPHPARQPSRPAACR